MKSTTAFVLATQTVFAVGCSSSETDSASADDALSSTTADAGPTTTDQSQTSEPADTSEPASAPSEPTTSSEPSPPADPIDIAAAIDAFANSPSPSTFDALPLAEQVTLGLGPNIITQLDAAALRDSSAWQIKMPNGELFRGTVGPSSAIELIASGATDELVYAVGEHPHCAGPPVAAPPGFEDHQRVSVQPQADQIESCLQWFTVDLFINDGTIEAITHDHWEA